MRKQIPLDNPDQFPDLLSCFQGRTNGRQRAEYRRFLYRSIKTQLTQRQRQMMELRYFQGLSIPQIAQELHVNKSTVSRTINRALSRLRELAGQIEGSFIPSQFENPANARAHRETTGPEIWEDTEGTVDIFIAGAGTGGTVTGVGHYLKEKKSETFCLI